MKFDGLGALVGFGEPWGQKLLPGHVEITLRASFVQIDRLPDDRVQVGATATRPMNILPYPIPGSWMPQVLVSVTLVQIGFLGTLIVCMFPLVLLTAF